MWVNYTAYNLHRSQDSLNLWAHADIMVLSHEDQNTNPGHSHPYWYTQIIGTFHAMVQHTGPLSQGLEPQHISFFWICWYSHNFSHKTGWTAKRLHCIGFVDVDDPFAFNFLDLQCVICGVYLIPVFNHG